MSDIAFTDITSGAINGTGVFDLLMQSVNAQLKSQFDEGRVSGADYAQMYTASITGAMSQSIQFVLQEQAAGHQADLLAAQTLQTDAATAKINSEKVVVDLQDDLVNAQLLQEAEKLLLLKQDVLTAPVLRTKLTAEKDNALQQTLTEVQKTALVTSQKLKTDADELLSDARTATEVEKRDSEISRQSVNAADVNVKGAQVIQMTKSDLLTDEKILEAKQQVIFATNSVSKPTKEIAVMDAQIAKVNSGIGVDTKQNAKIDQDILWSVAKVTGIDNDNLQTLEQTKKIVQDTANSLSTNTTIIKQQGKIDAEKDLLTQKKYTEEAQILDTVNSLSVVGVIGKQKVLYGRQADGFLRDAEQKAAKIYADTWSIRQSTDGALTTSNGLADANILTAMTKLASGVA